VENFININDLNAQLVSNNLPFVTDIEYAYLQDKGFLKDLTAACGDLPAPQAFSYIQGTIVNLKSKKLNNQQRNNQSVNPVNSGSNNDTGTEQNTVFGESHHAYGKNWALCVSANKTRGGFHTINIEVAKAVAEKKYDWKNKLIVQVTENEMPTLVALVNGVLLNIEHKYHGPNKDKGYAINNQMNNGNFYFKVFAKGIVAQLPVIPSDFFYISRIIIEQMKKNMPSDMSYEAMNSMIRSIYSVPRVMQQPQQNR